MSFNCVSDRHWHRVDRGRSQPIHVPGDLCRHGDMLFNFACKFIGQVMQDRDPFTRLTHALAWPGSFATAYVIFEVLRGLMKHGGK